MREPGFTVLVKRTKVQVAEVIVIHRCMQKMHCAQSPRFSRTVISPSGFPVPNISIQWCFVMHYKHKMSVLKSDPHRTLASSLPDRRETSRTGGEDWRPYHHSVLTSGHIYGLGSLAQIIGHRARDSEIHRRHNSEFVGNHPVDEGTLIRLKMI